MKKIFILWVASLALLAGCGPTTNRPDIVTAVSSSQTTNLIPAASIDALTGQGYSIQESYKGNINIDWKTMISNLALLSKGWNDNQYIMTQYASWTNDAQTTSWKWSSEADKNGSWNSNMLIVTLFDKSNNPTAWFKKWSRFLIPLDKDWNQLKGWNLTLITN